MRGKHVFYPFGFDDNGLPTERLVERVTGKRAFEVGREEFIRLCQPIVADAEQQFIDLWQSLALSCDWTQFYTTINERSRAISQASFIDLYNKGYIYRKEAPTQWCWADQTAIAQAEIEDKEVAGHFHDIVFHIDDGSGKLTPVTIATTRPELIPACVAVFAHPDDARYQHLFGKKAITPLFEVEVPILPSDEGRSREGHRHPDVLHLRRHRGRGALGAVQPAHARGHRAQRADQRLQRALPVRERRWTAALDRASPISDPSARAPGTALAVAQSAARAPSWRAAWRA